MTIILLTLLFLLISPVHAEEVGLKIINTGPIDCKPGLVHRDIWTNTLGDINITQSTIWVGFTYRVKADMDVEVYRSDGNVLIVGPTDHYNDGSTFIQKYNNMDIRFGDFLRVDYFCNDFKGRNAQYHVVVWIWYQLRGGTLGG